MDYLYLKQKTRIHVQYPKGDPLHGHGLSYSSSPISLISILAVKDYAFTPLIYLGHGLVRAYLGKEASEELAEETAEEALHELPD